MECSAPELNRCSDNEVLFHVPRASGHDTSVKAIPFANALVCACPQAERVREKLTTLLMRVTPKFIARIRVPYSLEFNAQQNYERLT
jgi:hypothetical protein